MSSVLIHRESLPFVDFVDDGINATLLNRARSLVYTETANVFLEREKKKAECVEKHSSANEDNATEEVASLSSSSHVDALHPKVNAMLCSASSKSVTRSELTSSALPDESGAETHTTSTGNNKSLRFTPEQRLAIRQEYARGDRLRALAVSEAVSGGIVEARTAALREEERIFKRRRVEAVRATEDINAKRFLLHAGCLLAEGDGKIAEKLINDGQFD